MVAYTFRMPSAVAGVVSRDQHSTIQPELMLAASPLTAFGIPAIRDPATGKLRMPTGSDTIGMIVGFLVKPYPSAAAFSAGVGSDSIGVAIPNPLAIQNLMVRGYIGAVCNGATAPAKGGQVYFRIATPGTGKPIGGIEAAADGANTLAVPNCTWMGPCDAQGFVEVSYNI